MEAGGGKHVRGDEWQERCESEWTGSLPSHPAIALDAAVAVASVRVAQSVCLGVECGIGFRHRYLWCVDMIAYPDSQHVPNL